MKEREHVEVVLQNGEVYEYLDSEVTRAHDVLVVYTNEGTIRFNWQFVAFYTLWPAEVKNLDD